jgi:hypothetical protein
MALLRQEHLHEIACHQQFRQMPRRLGGGHRFGPERIILALSAGNEVSIENSLRHAGNREPRQGPPHVATNITPL